VTAWLTYATLLARAGVSLVQAQRLMRHSDPKLTANIYTRLRLDDGHAAVARIDLTAEGPRRVGRGP
jgi:integrase